MTHRFVFASQPAVRTGAAFAVMAVAGLGIAQANVEEVVARRFTTALETGQPIRSAANTGSALSNGALVSGSEAYWLAEKRRHDGDGIEPAAWATPLAAGVAVGDHITISGEKSERVLEVVAIADVEPAPGSAVDAAAPKQVAITCRDLSAPDGHLTTFLAPAGNAAVAAKSARAL